MREDSVVYVGVEAAKAKHAIAIAEGGRSGEVRYVGEIEATPAAVERFGRKLERKDPRLHFCYEAGPTGSGLSRHIVALGHRCEVVAPPWSRGARAITSRPTGATPSPWPGCCGRAS
jgi:transposase